MSHGGSSNLRVVLAALTGNGLIALSKFVAAFFSGSAATLAEAVHSVADTANQGLLIVGMKRSEKRPTTLHPFGHAVESYFWPFMVSILIFLLGGLFALVEGVRDLVALAGGQAETVHGSSLWSYGVLGVSLVFEAMSFRVAFAEFQTLRRSRSIWETLMHAKDPTIPVVLAEDTAALSGLVIAFVSVGLSDVTGWHGFDAIGSLLIGLLLGAVAVFLSKRTHSLLIGEAIVDEDRMKVESVACSTEGVRAVRQVLSMHLGPTNVILALKVGFDPELSMAGLEQTIDLLEARIREALPHMRYIFIEPDADYTLELDEDRPAELPARKRRRPGVDES
jgi:cation diffusion facilitator family transporter